VEIVPGGPGAPQLVITELAAERIQFAVSDADNVVKARAVGLPIVAVMAPLQNSPRCIMVHEASGVTRLEELANVELAISDSRPFALWMKKKLPLKNVTMVPFNGLVGEFLVKQNFAQQAYVFSEPFVAKEKGSDPKVLLVSDIGFNPYASVLITTEKVIKEKPELVRSVVSASLAGWERYLADPAATNAAIHEMNKEMSPAILEFGAQEMRPLCATAEGVPFCGMTPDRWQLLVSQIEEIEDIPKGSVKPEECFIIQFLQ
jgi:NitT/TauT family transport system substrate-binding protein